MNRRNVRCVTVLAITMLILGSLATSGCEKRNKTQKAPAPAAQKAPAPTAKKTPATPTTTTKAQTTCPVEGGKIDKSIYADYQGKRVYFCCAACKDKFKADPAKYVKQLEDKGITLEKVAK